MGYPLPFEGDGVTVTSILLGLGWEDSEAGDVQKLEYRLFYHEPELISDTENPVCWRHVQEAFRRSLLESQEYEEDSRHWTDEDEARYPVLSIAKGTHIADSSGLLGN